MLALLLLFLFVVCWVAFASLVLPVAGFVACVSGATAGGPQPGHGDIMRKGPDGPIVRKDGWFSAMMCSPKIENAHI